MAEQLGRSDDSAVVVVPNLLFTFIATLAVILRFWSSKLKGLRWSSDDYLAAAALVVQFCRHDRIDERNSNGP
jgi:hypothetical protein